MTVVRQPHEHERDGDRLRHHQQARDRVDSPQVDDPTYGLASSSSVAVSRDFRGGSTMPMTVATAAKAHTTAMNINPERDPRLVSSGIINAPNTIPSGCAVCGFP
jgi:hypothetical protein